MQNMNYQATVVALDTETGGLNNYVTLESGERVHGSLYYPLLELAFLLPKEASNGLLTYEDKPALVVGIKQSESMIKRYHPWALKQHTKSGVLNRLQTGEGFTYVAKDNEDAEQFIIDWLNKHGVEAYNKENRTGAILIGNNINFDHSFLDAQLPKLAAYFHYRKVDVSTINVLARGLWQHFSYPLLKKNLSHTALSDITESLDELNLYTEYLNGRFENK